MPSSDEFASFTWCAVKHSLSGRFGPYNSWVTILHSDANTAVFILQDVIPAFFSPGEVEREIQRLSQHFGQAARIYTEPLGHTSFDHRDLGRRYVDPA